LRDSKIDRRIGLWDTAAMPRIFEIGRRAAYDRLPEVRRLLDGLPTTSVDPSLNRVSNQ